MSLGGNGGVRVRGSASLSLSHRSAKPRRMRPKPLIIMTVKVTTMERKPGLNAMLYAELQFGQFHSGKEEKTG